MKQRIWLDGDRWFSSCTGLSNLDRSQGVLTWRERLGKEGRLRLGYQGIKVGIRGRRS